MPMLAATIAKRLIEKYPDRTYPYGELKACADSWNVPEHRVRKISQELKFRAVAKKKGVSP
jgi:hypothetical protein